jgi:outer membrane protein assembly factor BamB
MRNSITILSIFLTAISLHAQSCWPNFRGDPQFTGTSTASIPSNPSLLWNFKTNDAIKAAPVVCDGIIVVGSVDGNVYGITMEGKLKWKINTGNGIEASALIHKGVAYIGNLDGKVFAIELTTGKTLWTYATEGQIMGAPNYWGRGDGILVIGSYDYYLHGIDAASGKGLWKYEADNFINGAPAIYEDIAIFGGCDGLLHQVNIADGSLKNRQPVATYVAGSVAVENWITYVGDYDGKFSCVDLKSGKEVWSYENPETQLPFIASPSLSKNKVFIGNRDKYVYCFQKKSGELLWKINARGRVDASPVLIGDRLLVATMSGDVLLLDVDDGSVKWSYELGSPVFGNPAVMENHIIVGAEDGRIYCFGKK